MHLWLTDRLGERGKLAIDIRRADIVGIHQGERADAGAGERLDRPGTNPADADDANPRGLQPGEALEAKQPRDAAKSGVILRVLHGYFGSLATKASIAS